MSNNELINDFLELFESKYFYRKTNDDKIFIEFEIYGIGNVYSVSVGTLILRYYKNDHVIEIGNYDSKREDLINIIVDDIRKVFDGFETNKIKFKNNSKMYILSFTLKTQTYVDNEKNNNTKNLKQRHK